jgi:hypothetical protein
MKVIATDANDREIIFYSENGELNAIEKLSPVDDSEINEMIECGVHFGRAISYGAWEIEIERTDAEKLEAIANVARAFPPDASIELYRRGIEAVLAILD